MLMHLFYPTQENDADVNFLKTVCWEEFVNLRKRKCWEMGNGVSLVVSTVQQILQGCTYWGGWHSQNIHSVHGEGDTKYSQSVRYLRSKN